MNRLAGKLPRLDLVPHHMQSLSLNITTEWDDDLIDLFAVDDDELPLLFDILGGEDPPLILAYGRHKSKYAILLYAGPSETSEEDEAAVLIRYTAVPADLSLFSDKGRTEARFLGRLLKLPPKAPIQVLVELDFGPVPEANLWFPLPQRLGGPPPAPVFEARGIRGAKLAADGGTAEYQFTLDRSEENNVVLLLEFQAEPTFDLQTPTRILERADMIAKEMVRL